MQTESGLHSYPNERELGERSGFLNGTFDAILAGALLKVRSRSEHSRGSGIVADGNLESKEDGLLCGWRSHAAECLTFTWVSCRVLEKEGRKQWQRKG